MHTGSQYLQQLWQNPWEWAGFLLSALWVYLLARLWLKRQHLAVAQQRIFWGGLALRAAGGLALCLTYTWLYEGGDLGNYYLLAKVLLIRLYEQPDAWLPLVSPEYALPYLTDDSMSYVEGVNDTGYRLLESHPLGRESCYLYQNTAGYWVVRLVALLMVPALGSFGGVAVLGSALAFAGSWLLYRLLCRRIVVGRLVIVLLFAFPGMVFWLSGASKDALVWFGWALALYGLLSPPRKGRWHWAGTVLAILLGGTLVYLLRSSLFWATIPLWAAIGGYRLYRRLSLRRGMAYVLLGSALFFTGWVLSQVRYGHFGILGYAQMLREYSLSYNQKGVTSPLFSFSANQNPHIIDIGAYDPTPAGVVKKLPLATLTGLYRPFPWSATHITSLIAGLDNLLWLLMCLWLVLLLIKRPTPSRELRLLASLLILFGLLYAAFVGLSVPFAGSLVRYKVIGLWAVLGGLCLWSSRLLPDARQAG
ncbi:MAG: hypothetical protein KF690_10395 [Bacteroidetes bacterium]|nr:hypothetical protein [Bacteroidota bacterium]